MAFIDMVDGPRQLELHAHTEYVLAWPTKYIPPRRVVSAQLVCHGWHVCVAPHVARFGGDAHDFEFLVFTALVTCPSTEDIAPITFSLVVGDDCGNSETYDGAVTCTLRSSLEAVGCAEGEPFQIVVAEPTRLFEPPHRERWHQHFKSVASHGRGARVVALGTAMEDHRKNAGLYNAMFAPRGGAGTITGLLADPTKEGLWGWLVPPLDDMSPATLLLWHNASDGGQQDLLNALQLMVADTVVLATDSGTGTPLFETLSKWLACMRKFEPEQTPSKTLHIMCMDNDLLVVNGDGKAIDGDGKLQDDFSNPRIGRRYGKAISDANRVFALRRMNYLPMQPLPSANSNVRYVDLSHAFRHECALARNRMLDGTAKEIGGNIATAHAILTLISGTTADLLSGKDKLSCASLIEKVSASDETISSVKSAVAETAKELEALTASTAYDDEELDSILQATITKGKQRAARAVLRPVSSIDQDFNDLIKAAVSDANRANERNSKALCESIYNELNAKMKKYSDLTAPPVNPTQFKVDFMADLDECRKIFQGKARGPAKHDLFNRLETRAVSLVSALHVAEEAEAGNAMAVMEHKMKADMTQAVLEQTLAALQNELKAAREFAKRESETQQKAYRRHQAELNAKLEQEEAELRHALGRVRQDADASIAQKETSLTKQLEQVKATSAASKASMDHRISQQQSELDAERAAVESARGRLKALQAALEAQRRREAEARAHRGGGCCIAADAAVEVDGRGSVPLSSVRAGDRVATRTTGGRTFTDVYFAAGVDWPSALVSLDVVGDGVRRNVRLSADHMAIRRSSGSTEWEAIHAGAIHIGDVLVSASGQPLRVAGVSLTPPLPMGIVLTTAGTLCADGVLVSCYDGGHLLGAIENLDLRLLYHCAPLWVVRSRLVRRYASLCDAWLHGPMRRALGLCDRAGLEQSATATTTLTKAFEDTASLWGKTRRTLTSWLFA